PMLVPFPIAFLTGAFVCDLVGRLIDSSQWYSTGAYLAFAGIVAGLIAAVPGIIDYASVVPPNSSARKRATYHMVVNVGAITLFIIGWLYRGDPSFRPDAILLGLEAGGLLLMTVGGWM